MNDARDRQAHSAKDRLLQEPRITEEQFGKYWKMFCIDRQRDRFAIKRAWGWPQSRHYWGRPLIREHLSGRLIVGLLPAERIDYLMLDIDNHSNAAVPPLMERCEQVLRAFGGNPLIYTSSDSGGIRICHFLKSHYRREDVMTFAKQRLSETGAEIQSGSIEVMAINKPDRLPFGNGSYIVDRDTLSPLKDISLADRIDAAWAIYESDRLIIGVDLLSKPLPEKQRRNFNEFVSELYENGLPPPPFTTFEAENAIVWDRMVRRGESREEAAQFTKNWLANKHNGNSDSINSSGFDKKFDEIDRLTKCIERKKGKFQGLEKLNRRLTVGDVNRICNLFEDYKEQLAAFSLLQWVKNRGIVCANENGIPGIREEEKRLLVTYGVSFLQVHVCQIPYKAFQRFPGFDWRKPGEMLEKLEKSGVLQLSMPHDRDRGLCRTYKIRFSFDTESPEVVSLDDGILSLRSDDQIRVLYGRYRAEKIIKQRKTA